MASFNPDYCHRFQYQSQGDFAVTFPVGKAVCVGRNYADHAAELNNPVPEEPLLFIKPATAMAAFSGNLNFPRRFAAAHYETEMTLLIGKRLCCASIAQAWDAIAGVGVGLDLTLRALQNSLKEKGHPWERAKAFDGSCVLSTFAVPDATTNLQNLDVRLWRNGELVQNCNTGEMLFPVLPLLCKISRSFTLVPGDVVMTGTPKGVGELKEGDKLVAELGTLVAAEATVILEND
jgi:2-keto-4-pentenoate hydratase/2-oxohepta-3-ene-1,7-dioic acid hydratase in catechol pathway